MTLPAAIPAKAGNARFPATDPLPLLVKRVGYMLLPWRSLLAPSFLLERSPQFLAPYLAIVHSRIEMHDSINAPLPNHHLHHHSHDDTSTANTTSLSSPTICLASMWGSISTPRPNHPRVKQGMVQRGMLCGELGLWRVWGNNCGGKRR